MKIVCWQTILMKYHTLFLLKIGKVWQNLSSAAVVIGPLRVKTALLRSMEISTKLDTVKSGWSIVYLLRDHRL